MVRELIVDISLSLSHFSVRLHQRDIKRLKFRVTDRPIDICVDPAVLLEKFRWQHPKESGGLQEREDV